MRWSGRLQSEFSELVFEVPPVTFEVRVHRASSRATGSVARKFERVNFGLLAPFTSPRRNDLDQKAKDSPILREYKREQSLADQSAFAEAALRRVAAQVAGAAAVDGRSTAKNRRRLLERLATELVDFGRWKR